MRVWLTRSHALIALLTGPGPGGETATPKSELKTEADSGVQAYLSLPNGWDLGKAWPIFVAIDGSGHNFAGVCQQFRQHARGAAFHPGGPLR
jgi:hypothetical protein